MITDNERREVAKELRKLATPGCIRYAEEFYEELREIVAFDRDGSFDGVANSLADLIDRPTCTIVCECDAYSSWGERIEGMRLYELSCGHQAVGFEKPRYCPECGMEVVKRDQQQTTERLQPAARML